MRTSLISRLQPLLTSKHDLKPNEIKKKKKRKKKLQEWEEPHFFTVILHLQNPNPPVLNPHLQPGTVFSLNFLQFLLKKKLVISMIIIISIDIKHLQCCIL